MSLHLPPVGIIKPSRRITLGTPDSDVDGVNNTAFSFTFDAGTGADDLVVLIAAGVDGGSSGTISSVVVNGSATGVNLLKSGTLDVECHSAIYGKALPAGGSFTVGVSCGGSSKGNCGVVIQPVYGASLTPTDVAASNANPGTDSIAVAKGGLIFGYMNVNSLSGDRTYSWNVLAEIADEVVEAGQTTHGAGCSIFNAADASKTLTCTPSGTTSSECMVAVSLPVA